MQWYRAYIGMACDPKFRVVARIVGCKPAEALAIWICVLEQACGNGGSIQGLDINDIGYGLDIDVNIVQRVLETMHEKKLITADNKITKWDKRQYVSDTSTKRVHAFRQRQRNVSETHQNRTEQIRTESETRAPSAAPTKGTRFPHEGLPDSWKQFCLEKRPDLDPSATFDRCRDYWIAAPGQRGVKRDWDATWRNWVRNERKPNGHAPPLTITSGPPKGFREAKSTGEYVLYMQEKTGDPKLTFGDYRLSKHQFVPADWHPNVTQIRKAGRA